MRNREEVFEKVKTATQELLGCNDTDIKYEASFSNDLGADSLDALELCMEMEKVFDMSIPDHDFEKINTVGELVDYITYGTLPDR